MAAMLPDLLKVKARLAPNPALAALKRISRGCKALAAADLRAHTIAIRAPLWRDRFAQVNWGWVISSSTRPLVSTPTRMSATAATR